MARSSLVKSEFDRERFENQEGPQRLPQKLHTGRLEEER
jgi:hypothetical protein